MFYFRNLQAKLETKGYMVDDAEGNLDFIETEKQIIFICTGTRNDEINRLMMNAVEQKINKVKDPFSILFFRLSLSLIF